jgi:hypothetical protein
MIVRAFVARPLCPARAYAQASAEKIPFCSVPAMLISWAMTTTLQTPRRAVFAVVFSFVFVACSDTSVTGMAEGQGAVSESSETVRTGIGEHDSVNGGELSGNNESDTAGIGRENSAVNGDAGAGSEGFTDTGEPGPAPCVPKCVESQCGDDGCGGSCGQCPEQAPYCLEGLCVLQCEPECEGKQCGSDGCGGSCGQCPAGSVCQGQICACVSQCTGKECGPDGCGSECGTCTSAEFLCVEGICSISCQPDCADKECGSDGCGGVCGMCPAIAPFCVNHYCALSCTPSCDGKDCGDDGCGGSCGECLDAEFCKEGFCLCVPNCDGKQCDTDGCGGSCGVCPASAPYCVESHCEDQCPLDCAGKECGDDGCGDVCGICPDVAPFCVNHLCALVDCTPDCEGKNCGEMDGCEGTCGECKCVPGTTSCQGSTKVLVCNETGEAWVNHDTCSEDAKCQNGACLTPCQVSEQEGSYLGCEFWVVDLDNVGDAEQKAIGLVVTVPAGSAGTAVSVYNNDNQMELDAAALGVVSTFVAPGQLRVFQLPTGYDIDGTTLTTRTFKVVTTTPVAVHQFNPLNGEGVHTSDASLLLPAKVTGQQYYVMSWPHRVYGDGELRGFVTVVATQPGTTNVAVEPACGVAAGGGVPELEAGKTYLFVLKEGQAFNLETMGEQGADLTGTYLSADQKISVMAGHECANVPLGIDNCDHLEQQLFALETWSYQYIAAAFKPRSPSQVDIWRVMAGNNDVVVTTNPPVPGYETFKLQRGQWIHSSVSIRPRAWSQPSAIPPLPWRCRSTGFSRITPYLPPKATLKTT